MDDVVHLDQKGLYARRRTFWFSYKTNCETEILKAVAQHGGNVSGSYAAVLGSVSNVDFFFFFFSRKFCFVVEFGDIYISFFRLTLEKTNGSELRRNFTQLNGMGLTFRRCMGDSRA